MQTALEKLEGLHCRLKVIVPAEEVKKSYHERLKKLAKSLKLDGFRPGKVPMDVIERRFKKDICHEVAGELIQTNFEKAVQEQKLQIAGRPEVDPQELHDNQDFEFAATFEVYPEIQLQDLEGETIEKKVAQITDENISKTLEQIRRQHADWEEVSRAAIEGDRLLIDFKGFVDGEAFAGGEAKDFKLELGSKQMVPGFEQGLIGSLRGDEKEITITFPEEYDQELKGKTALFKVTVHKVYGPLLPSSDDALAEKIGVKGGLEQLKQEIKKNLETELQRAIEIQLKSQVFDKLLEKNQFSVPETLLNMEIEHLQQMTLQQMALYTGKKEIPNVDLPKAPYEQRARKRVALGLLLSEVIKKYSITLDEDKLLERVEELAAAYQNPGEIVSLYYKNKKLLSEIEAAVLEDQAVHCLLEKAQVVEKQSNFDEIMSSQTVQDKG